MPNAFWVCLLEYKVVYTHLDMQNPKDQQILASAFVDQLANDMRNHIHWIVSKRYQSSAGFPTLYMTKGKKNKG